MHIPLLFFAVALTGLATAPGSRAQAINAQTVPNTARPELIEQRLRIEEPRPDVGGAALISVRDEHGKEIKGNINFVLNSVAIEGGTAFDEAKLKQFYEEKLGTRINLAELNEISAGITAYYRNHGYILTRAILPPQRISGGNVTVRVVEGFVSDVLLQGEVEGSRVLAEYAEKIKASKPLDAKVLERYLLLMEDLPGVQARAVLQPSPDVPGASQVIINITRKPIEASLSLDNRGSRFLGPYQLGGTVAFNNVLGLDEQTQFRVIDSIFDGDEIRYAEARHEEQLGLEGTKLVLAGNVVKTNPGARLEEFDIEGITSSFSAGLAHPLLRSRQSNWFINGDYTYRRTSVSAFDTNLYEDKLSVFSVGTSVDFLDGWSAVNRADIELSQGVNWGVNTNGLGKSRAGGETDFTKIAGHITRIQPIDGPWAATASIAGQYGFDVLLASEEFALGGAEFGSAYDPAELTGDSGLAARLELQFNQDGVDDFFSQYQLYGFYDIGRVWNRDIIAGELDHASLASAGLGARFNVIDAVSGGVELAVPLTRDVAAYGADGGDPRVLFNLLYRY